MDIPLDRRRPRQIIRDAKSLLTSVQEGASDEPTYLTSTEAHDTPGMLDWMYSLTETNMSELYEACPGWGWDGQAKRQELGHNDARYLVIGRDAFVHLRYEMEGSEPVIYVYEIQVDAKKQGQQLGQRLMGAVELLAARLRFPRVMLTVFTGNAGARRFYEILGYKEDQSSPDDDAGYMILCKDIAL